MIWKWRGKRGYGSGSHNRSRGVAPATKEAGGRLRHEDGDEGGAGCQGQKEREKQSGGLFFLLFLGEGEQFGELLFRSGT